MTALHAGLSLLPDGATPFERAMSLTSADMREVDAEAIISAFDPWTCPAHILPWLAHTFSLDFWRDEWSETKKRTVVARAIELHFLKGTEAGLRAFVSLADAEVISVASPPQTIFCGPGIDRRAREQWLDALPQIRVWAIRERGQVGNELFCGAAEPKWNGFAETDFPYRETPPARWGRRARYVVGGVETDVPVSETEGVLRLHRRSTMQSHVFSDSTFGSDYFSPDDAESRLVTVAPVEDLPWRAAIRPQIAPVSATPDRVVVSGHLNAGVYSGSPADVDYFDPGDAEFRIYDRYAIHDGSDIASRPPDTEFMDIDRFDLAPHTAEVHVSAPGRRPVWEAGEGTPPTMGLFWNEPDAARIERVFEAVSVSMRHSDRILIRFHETPTFIYLPPSFADGDWRFGP